MTLSRLTYVTRIALTVCVLIGLAVPAFAATNSATGGIRGLNNGTLLGGDGTGSAQITINVVDLALLKQARDLGGNVLPDGAPVSPGQELYFVLYVDNFTDAAAGDIRMVDPLDETQFTYVPGSIEETIVPSGSDDAAIWAGTWSPLTDVVGAPDDEASATDSGGPAGLDTITVGAEPGQANQQLAIPGQSLRAIRFRVTVN